MKTRRFILYVAGASVVVAGIALGLKATKGPEKTEALAQTGAQIERYVAAEGKVEAMPGFEVSLGSDIYETIEAFHKKEGEAVYKQDLVVTLRSDEVRARLKQAEEELKRAESRLAEARSGSREEEINGAEAMLEGAVARRESEERAFERHKKLAADGLVSTSMLEEKEREYRVALAEAKEAEQRLRLLKKGEKPEVIRLREDEVRLARAGVEYQKALFEKTQIKSPIAGVLIHKNLDEGEIVVPEVPIATIADLTRLWINAEVDETDAGLVKVGNAVDVTSEAYRGMVFKGRVAEIAEYAGVRTIKPNDPAKHVGMKVMQVKIALEEKTDLKIGMTVDLRIRPDAKKKEGMPSADSALQAPLGSPEAGAKR